MCQQEFHGVEGTKSAYKNQAVHKQHPKFEDAGELSHAATKVVNWSVVLHEPVEDKWAKSTQFERTIWRFLLLQILSTSRDPSDTLLGTRDRSDAQYSIDNKAWNASWYLMRAFRGGLSLIRGDPKQRLTSIFKRSVECRILEPSWWSNASHSTSSVWCCGLMSFANQQRFFHTRTSHIQAPVKPSATSRN